MQYVRTLIWVAITAFVVLFVTMNWGEPQEVRIWPSSDGDNFLFEWPVGVIAIAFFLLGMIPTWIYHRGVKWSLNRRITSLENAVRSNSLSARHSAPPPSPSPAQTAADASDAGTAGDTLKPDDSN